MTHLLLKTLAGPVGVVIAVVLMFFVIPHPGMWRDAALELLGILTTVGMLALNDND